MPGLRRARAVRADLLHRHQYESLISGEHGESHGEEEAVLYTDEDIKRAVTEGVEPDGESLEWPMPRWTMSDQDLDDLLEFLKTLD